MYCPHCGQEVSEQHAFCFNCGSDLSSVKSFATSSRAKECVDETIALRSKQEEPVSDEDSSNLLEQKLSDGDKCKTLLQVCSWIHGANDENLTQDIVAHLPDHIVFPEHTKILPSDVSNLFYALRSSSKSHTIDVDNWNVSGDSLKLFSKQVSSSNIKIQTFNLFSKKLSDIDFSSIVEISQHVEKKLWLEDCEITSCHVSLLAKKLRESGHKIQHLILSGNEIGDEGFTNLFCCLKSIQMLTLSGCDISSASCAEFAEKLIETGHNIQYLDLSWNKFGDEGFSNLLPCLKNIQELELNNCDISSASCAKFAEKLIETGHNIQYLDLSRNKFADKGFTNLVGCLKNIQELELSCCDISSASFAKFAEKLIETGHNIQYLNLSFNHFCDEGFANLVLCLKNIQKLKLSGCDISRAGCGKFAEKLMETGLHIQYLDLSWNKFGDEGLSNLFLCLKNILKLVLRNCIISSAGCAKFAEKLKETGHNFEYLDLSHNQLIGDGAMSFMSCLHLIEELRLEGCNVTEAVKEEIRSELKRLDLPKNRVCF